MATLATARKATWDIISAALGDFIANSISAAGSKVGEEGTTFVAERLKRSIVERRAEVVAFIRHDLWRKDGDYRQAAENLIEGQRLRQAKHSENWWANALADLYGAFDNRKRPEKPQLLSGKESLEVNHLLHQTWKEELADWEKKDEVLKEAKLEFFKELGLMSHEERDTFLQFPNDDAVQQFFARLGFEVKAGGKGAIKAGRKATEKIDKAALRATIPTANTLNNWGNALSGLRARREAARNERRRSR